MAERTKGNDMSRTRTSRWWPAGLLALPLLLIACVTINVYFPAAAAEKAADRIILDVYGKKPGQAPAKTPESKPDGQTSPDQSSRLIPHDGQHGPNLLVRLAFALVPPAQAAADLSISSPAIRSLTASMAARQKSLQPYFANGAIGLTNDGLIALRKPGAVPLKERNRLRKLIEQENQDRNALYREIARANGHPEWEQQIRGTFARRWVANAPKGWWYQDAKGNWAQKQ